MTDTTLEPPAERELPPGRHDALRAQLLQQIDDRPPRSHTGVFRRRLIPMVAAAAVLAVIALVVTVLVSAREKPAPTVNRPDQMLIDPTVPGYTSAELTTVKRACLTAVRSQEQGSGGFGRPHLDDSIDVASLRVYNFAMDRFGAMALLYGTDGTVACGWNWVPARSTTPTVSYLATKQGAGSFEARDPHWLDQPISVDLTSSSSGGNSKLTTMQVGGRVPSDVARLEVTGLGRTTSITPMNGTFIALVTANAHADGAMDPQIRAYDRANKLLYTYGAASSPGKSCLVTPDGKVLIGKKGVDTSKCAEAVPWR